MRFRELLVAAAVLASTTARAAPADPAAAAPPPGAEGVGIDPGPPSGSAAAAPAPPAVAADPSAPPAWRRGYAGTVGVGYYERFHAGVAYLPSRASAIGIFGGTDFQLGDDSTWDLGLSYAHALGRFRRLDAGLAAKAIYWEQSSPDYDWKMMSFVAGAYLAQEIHPRFTLALDAGVALNFSVDTERKQNVNYEYPTRWNGSVALALQYRFDQW